MYIPNDYDKVQYLEAGWKTEHWAGWHSEKGVSTELLRHPQGVSTLDETVDQAPRREPVEYEVEQVARTGLRG